MITRRGSRHCKEQCECGANEGQPERCQDDLSETERDGAGYRANNDRSDRPRTAVIGCKPSGKASEEGKCVYCQGKCGVPKNVAQSRSEPPISETRRFLRHIFAGSERSQAAQKGHDIWLPGPSSSYPSRAAPSQRRERSLLCCEVDLDVDVGGIKRHVSEPGPDRIDVDACLQQVGGGRVADDMGTDPLATERRQSRMYSENAVSSDANRSGTSAAAVNAPILRSHASPKWRKIAVVWRGR
jgi:hypothetical protein